eukprot:8390216-Pyramimonas_sp.AAC.1
MSCGIFRYVADFISRVGFAVPYLTPFTAAQWSARLRRLSATTLQVLFEPLGILQSYASIASPRGHAPRATQTPISIRNLTATSGQTTSRNPTGET